MKKPKTRATGFLALFATFLVVGGVVFVAILATPTINPDARPTELRPSPIDGPAATSTQVLVIDADGARIVASGGSTPLTWPTDVKRLGRSVSSLEGIDALTGERVYLGNGFERAMSAGIRSPDGRRSLHPSPAKADGTGSIEVRLGSDRQTIVLRLSNGNGVKDAMPIGWWDTETVAVIGRTTSTRTVYAVSLSGTVTRIASMPDMADQLAVRDGSVWYVTAEPGEGLESPFLPPSELHRLRRSGTDERLAREPHDVIRSYVSFGDELAYVTEAGEIFLVSDRSMHETPLGTGVPLAFRDASHLFIRRDLDIVSKNVITGLEESLVALDAQGALIFPLQQPSTAGE